MFDSKRLAWQCNLRPVFLVKTSKILSVRLRWVTLVDHDLSNFKTHVIWDLDSQSHSKIGVQNRTQVSIGFQFQVTILAKPNQLYCSTIILQFSPSFLCKENLLLSGNFTIFPKKFHDDVTAILDLLQVSSVLYSTQWPENERTRLGASLPLSEFKEAEGCQASMTLPFTFKVLGKYRKDDIGINKVYIPLMTTTTNDFIFRRTS